MKTQLPRPGRTLRQHKLLALLRVPAPPAPKVIRKITVPAPRPLPQAEEADRLTQ